MKLRRFYQQLWEKGQLGFNLSVAEFIANLGRILYLLEQAEQDGLDVASFREKILAQLYWAADTLPFGRPIKDQSGDAKSFQMLRESTLSLTVPAEIFSFLENKQQTPRKLG